MALHSLKKVTIGVPNVDDTVQYYTDFGLQPLGGGAFATRDGGEQFGIVHAPTRRLIEIVVGVDNSDDLARISSRLDGLGFHALPTLDNCLVAAEPVSGFTVRLQVLPRLVQPRTPATPYNGPGRVDRTGRAPGILRTGPVQPRKLGHAVVGTVDLETTMAFFLDGLGFKTSDYIKGHGAFMRCSTDHHNILAMAAPVNFLHHTSWQVDDIDEIGRGASAMLEDNPERHVWGLGRHYAGANFFWYLKDPAGNFSEYYSDMDCIPDEEIWTPETLEGARGLFNWGPPPPPSFLAPEDLGSLMTGVHNSN